MAGERLLEELSGRDLEVWRIRGVGAPRELSDEDIDVLLGFEWREAESAETLLADLQQVLGALGMAIVDKDGKVVRFDV